MKTTLKILALTLSLGLVLTGCQSTDKRTANQKDGSHICCGKPMQSEGHFIDMKCPKCNKQTHIGVQCPTCHTMMTADTSKNTLTCPKCGKTAPMQKKCSDCGTMMNPTGETHEIYRCPDCGKMEITGGSIDTPG